MKTTTNINTIIVSLFAVALMLTSSLAISADGIPNLNTSPASVIASAIRGVGPAKAQAIVAARPFASLADVDAVKGIGPVTLGTIQGLIDAGSLTLGSPSAPTAQTPAETVPAPTPTAPTAAQ